MDALDALDVLDVLFSLLLHLLPNYHVVTKDCALLPFAVPSAEVSRRLASESSRRLGSRQSCPLNQKYLLQNTTSSVEGVLESCNHNRVFTQLLWHILALLPVTVFYFATRKTSVLGTILIES